MRISRIGPKGICRFALLSLVTSVSTVYAGAENQERAPIQELTLSVGGIPGQTRSYQDSAAIAQISADRSFGINDGHYFLGAKIVAL